MLSRFRRPDPPYTPDFWDRLETDLRRRANEERRKASGKSRFATRYLRSARSLARPAFHGAMVLVSVVLVAALARPGTVADLPTSTAEGHSDRVSAWVPVVEVEDPRAPLVMHSISHKTDRFVIFIDSISDSAPEPVEPVEPVAI